VPVPADVEDSAASEQLVAPVGEGVNLVGYLRAELGVGEHARQVAGAVSAMGVPLATCSVSGVRSREGHEHTDLTPVPGVANPFDVNLVCLNPPGLRRWAAEVGPGFFANRLTVGYWAWELEEFPARWASALDLVDEVWMNSRHAAAGLRRCTDKPVEVFPVPVQTPRPAPVSRAELGLPDGFLFLFIYDYLSVAERKNPVGLVQAFRQAFRPGEGPVLLLKSINGNQVPHEHDRVRNAAAGRADIILSDGYLPASHKDALLAVGDCYVSLHRAEGFGITMAEAMALGKPTIGTGYSGNLEFMTAENSYLVGWSEGAVPRGCRPYREGAKWAEPDLEEAASVMRRVYEHPEEARRVGEAARAHIARFHSPAARAVLLAELLRGLRARGSRSGGFAVDPGGPAGAVAWGRRGGPMADDNAMPAAEEVPSSEDQTPAQEAEAVRARLREVAARLERAERENGELQSRLEHLQAELRSRPVVPLPAAVPAGKVLVDQAAHEDLRQAKRDLVRLLRRLGRPPFGWVLRRQKGYRRLRQRWLREG
jgi:glycosyltransferase involved in cell wall biosynthesis